MIHRWKGLRQLNPNDPLGLLFGLAESRNSRWRTPDQNFNLNTYSSARSQHRNEISKAKVICFGPPIQWNYRECCTTWPEVRNSRWRPPKPDKPSQLVDRIETKLQRLSNYVFEIQLSNGTIRTQCCAIKLEETGNTKSKMAACKFEIRIILACRPIQDRNEIPTAITMLARSSKPMILCVLWWDLTGSMKTKMASFKPEVSLSQLVNNIGTKFQRLYQCFRGQATRGDKWQYCPMSR